MSNIFDAIGSGVSGAMPYIKSGLGTGVEVLDLANALASRSPGAFLQELANRNAALQDPNMRAQIQGSPFLAGYFGVPLGQNFPTPASAQMSPPEGPSLPPNTALPASATVPQLPPLQPLQAAEQQLIQQNPQMVARGALGLPLLGADQVMQMAKFVGQEQQQTPNVTYTYDSNGILHAAIGQKLSVQEFPTREAAEFAGGPGYQVIGPTGRGTYILRRLPAGGGTASPETLRALGLTPPDADVTNQGDTTQQPYAVPPDMTPFPGANATNPHLPPDMPASAAPPYDPNLPRTAGDTSAGPLVVNKHVPEPQPGSQAIQGPMQGPPQAVPNRLGYPSVAFGAEQGAQPTMQPAQREFPPPRAAAPARPTAPPGTAPGTKVTAKIAPGVTVTKSGPQQKEDFTVIASQRVIPLLNTGLQAVKTLRKYGVLADDPISASGANMARLQFINQYMQQQQQPGQQGTPNYPQIAQQFGNAATQGYAKIIGLDPRVLQNPDVGQAAAFVMRNLQSTVPLLARGFGEQRTNKQEEARLAQALTFRGSAYATEATLENFLYLFSYGSPKDPKFASEYPTYNKLTNEAYGGTNPGAQRFIQQAQPVE